ncbi:hypothetical protein [Clostridium perfringens]|uniref:Uncharacterized protein n=1 Tax=Clostridium perfringens TaxID=1502 RepID=A0ABD4PRX6_CLOPF|nr:hypothetical protein [Clostridium perfringens]MBO3417956.1 hypothetical protein [Clostridium perfringens]
MLGYIQALIDMHKERYEKATGVFKNFEEASITELENLKKFYLGENREKESKTNDFRMKLETEVLTRTSEGKVRKFYSIKAGEYLISVQASKFHECIPQATLINIGMYKSMAVSILDEDSRVINLEEDSFFDEWENREAFLVKYDGETGKFIPIEVIQSLFDYIEEKSND